MNAKSLVMVIALWAAAAAASAQELLPPDTTVTVADIMNRMAALMGGPESVGGIRTAHIVGHSRLPNSVRAATIEVWWAQPNLFRAVTRPPVGDAAECGFDGRVCWQREPKTGPRIISGEEAGDLILEYHPGRFILWRDLYLNADLIGADSVFGELCDIVRLVPDQGRAQDVYLSRSAGLPVMIKTERAMGARLVAVNIYLSDYRATGGTVLPWRSLMEFSGRTRTMQVDKVSLNGDPPADIFSLPDDVRVLAAAPDDPR